MSDLSIANLLREVRNGYQGDGVRHKTRIAFAIVIGFIISLSAGNISGSTLDIVSLTISILMGFTFTALFSNISSARLELPSPINETDRRDIDRMIMIEGNLHTRSKLLILIGCVVLILSFLLSVKVDGSAAASTSARLVASVQLNIQIDWAVTIFVQAWQFLSFLCFATVATLFFEALYTFYRLSETVLALLQVRHDYLNARQ